MISAYVYVLGLYLGDGTIAFNGRSFSFASLSMLVIR
jgi:hypothetical protein